MLSRNLAFSGLTLVACFILLPRVIFGSAYADMRLVPYMLAIFVLAIRFKAETVYPLARTLALAGVAFLLVRTAGTTASFAIAANHQRQQLARARRGADGVARGVAGVVAVQGLGEPPQRPSAVDGDRPPRRLRQRPMAARRDRAC